MSLVEEIIKSQKCINDALQYRAMRESYDIQNGLGEYKKVFDQIAKEFLKANNVIKVGNPFIPFIPWSDDSGRLVGVDPAKDDTDLHINVKRRKIKFNFNN